MTEKRRATILARLKRELAAYLAKPEPRLVDYANASVYKRVATLRRNKIKRLQKQIATLEAGRDFGEYME